MYNILIISLLSYLLFFLFLFNLECEELMDCPFEFLLKTKQVSERFLFVFKYFQAKRGFSDNSRFFGL